MATVQRTLSFGTDAEGLADQAVSAVAFAYEGADGNPAGSVKFTYGVKGATASEQARTSGTTWASLFGIPSDATVNTVRVVSYQRKVAGVAKLSSHSIILRIVDGAGATIGGDLASETLPTATSGWLAGGGIAVAQTVGQVASSTARLGMQYTVTTLGGGGTAATDARFDNVVYEIDYTEAAVVPASIDQWEYRGRNDDGSETTATWIAAINTGWSRLPDTVFRVRFGLRNPGTSEWNANGLQLEYRRNGGTWTDVTTTSTVVRAADGSPANDVGTSRQLTASGTFADGLYTEDGHIGWPASNIPAGGTTEHEFAVTIRGVDVVAGDTIELRLTKDDGAALDTYTVAGPAITVASAPATQSISAPVVLGSATLAAPTLTATIPSQSIASPAVQGSATVPAPTVTAGPRAVAGIAALGSATLATPTLAVTAPSQSIASPATIGSATLVAPTVSRGAVAIAGPPLLGGAAVAAPTVQRGAVTFTVPALGGATLQAPAFRFTVYVSPLGTAAIAAPTLLGAQATGPIPLLGGASIVAPTVASGVQVPALGGASVATPSLRSSIAVGVLGTALMGTPGVTLGAATVSTSALGTAVLLPPTASVGTGPQASSPPPLGSASLGIPTFQLQLAPARLGGATPVAPAVSQSIVLDVLGGSSLAAPTVQAGAVQVQPLTLGGAIVSTPVLAETASVGFGTPPTLSGRRIGPTTSGGRRRPQLAGARAVPALGGSDVRPG